MHGTLGGPYYKGGHKGNAGTFNGNTSNNSGGNPGKSLPQQPIACSDSPGPPASMKAALAKKSGPSVNGAGAGGPSKNTSFPGSIR